VVKLQVVKLQVVKLQVVKLQVVKLQVVKLQVVKLQVGKLQVVKQLPQVPMVVLIPDHLQVHLLLHHQELQIVPKTSAMLHQQLHPLKIHFETFLL